MTLNVSLSIPGSQQQDEDIYLNQMATIEFPNKPSGEPMKSLTSIKQALIFSASPNQTLAQEFLTYLVQPNQLEQYMFMKPQNSCARVKLVLYIKFSILLTLKSLLKIFGVKPFSKLLSIMSRLKLPSIKQLNGFKKFLLNGKRLKEELI